MPAPDLRIKITTCMGLMTVKVILLVSRFDEVHELAVVSTENTGIEQFGDPYSDR